MRARQEATKVAPIRLKIHRRKLANGLTLLAARTRSAPTLAIAASFEISQLNEATDRAGIATLVGNVLDEGTERYSGDELAELVEGLGGQLHAAGSGASVRVAAEDAAKAVRILHEVVTRPTFPAKAVRRARDLLVAEIHADQDEPRTVAGRAFKQAVYGQHPYARDPKGTIETLDNLTPAKLRRFHKSWFTPDNGMLVAVGDVDSSKMLDDLERKFKGWKGKHPRLPEVLGAREAKGVQKQHIHYDRSQVQIFLGHLGIRRTDADYYKLLVMDHVLGSGPGFTSRIARKLRDEQGLCYAVGAGITGSAGRERGLFTAYIGTTPTHQKVAIAGFLAEIKRIRSEPPTPEELADVQAYLTGSFVWGLERNSNLAGFLLRAERFSLGDDYVARFPDLINAVTTKEVREVAERHLDPNNYYLVTLGP